MSFTFKRFGTGKTLGSFALGLALTFFPLKPLWAQTYLGNQAFYTGPGTLSMTASTSAEGIRFTMPTSNSVSLISIPGNVAAGTTAILQFGIQSDGATHFPSGTWLCESAPTTFTNNAEGWDSVAVSPVTPLTAGVTYHIVAVYASTATTFPWILDSGSTPATPGSEIIPFDQSIDPAMQLENGPSWTAQTNFKMVYALTFGDGTSYGNPYDTSDTITPIIYGTNYAGENFTVPGGSSVVINTLEVNGAKTGNATGSLAVTLLDLTTTSTMASGTMTLTQFGNTAGWVSIGLGTPVTLNATDTYQLQFSSTASTGSTKAYQLSTGGASSASPPLPGLSYNGTNSEYVYSTNSGSSWVTLVGYDLAYRFALAPQPTPTPITCGAPASFGDSNTEAGSGTVQNSIECELYTAPVGGVLMNMYVNLTTTG
ncbi:MAG TPA: hypothetical protein VJ873_12035, partial [bacterium]|nr:hypothetical protein [bacterium]